MKRDGVPVDESKVAAYIAKQKEARAALEGQIKDFEETSAAVHNIVDAKLAKLKKEEEEALHDWEEHIRKSPRTLDGKVVRNRGPAFARLVRTFHSKGHSFAAALATLLAHPNGVQAKFAFNVARASKGAVLDNY